MLHLCIGKSFWALEAHRSAVEHSIRGQVPDKILQISCCGKPRFLVVSGICKVECTRRDRGKPSSEAFTPPVGTASR